MNKMWSERHWLSYTSSAFSNPRVRGGVSPREFKYLAPAVSVIFFEFCLGIGYSDLLFISSQVRDILKDVRETRKHKMKDPIQSVYNGYYSELKITGTIKKKLRAMDINHVNLNGDLVSRISKEENKSFSSQNGTGVDECAKCLNFLGYPPSKTHTFPIPRKDG
jgi:hypothetical protein